MSNTQCTFATLRVSAVPFHHLWFYCVLGNVASAWQAAIFPSLKQNSREILLFLTVSRISAVFCKWHFDGSTQARILKGAYMCFLKIYQ